MKIGIVGHAEDKFTAQGKTMARNIMIDLLDEPEVILVSGRSPVGGIDIWAEEIADGLGIPKDIKAPRQKNWFGEYGYKARNLDIAKSSDIVFVLVVDKYPPNYSGMVFKECYHCHSSDHLKSGGCWTGLQARRMGKPVKWVIIKNGDI